MWVTNAYNIVSINLCKMEFYFPPFQYVVVQKAHDHVLGIYAVWCLRLDSDRGSALHTLPLLHPCSCDKNHWNSIPFSYRWYPIKNYPVSKSVVELIVKRCRRIRSRIDLLTLGTGQICLVRLQDSSLSPLVIDKETRTTYALLANSYALQLPGISLSGQPNHG